MNPVVAVIAPGMMGAAVAGLSSVLPYTLEEDTLTTLRTPQRAAANKTFKVPETFTSCV